MIGGPLRVTIGMLTFHRPDDLVAVIPMLLAQASDAESRLGDIAVDVLVVDNDPDGSGRSIIEGFADPRLRYEIEPTPGISHGRNRVLARTGASDLIVFIDDDERPHEQWLFHLLHTHRVTGAAAVAGRVVSQFVGELDPWVAAGAFFRRRQLPTGTRIDVAATNNLLLDMRQVRPMALHFDSRFGLSGADDTMFTRSLAARGALLVWCDDAVVTDMVPAARLTRSWVLRRAFSSGNGWGITTVALRDTRSGRIAARGTMVVHGIVRVHAGVIRYALGFVVHSALHQSRGLRTAARGVGMLVGTAGLAYQEYGNRPRRRLRRVRPAVAPA